MDELSKLITKKRWDVITAQYTPKELAASLTFEEGVKVADHIACFRDFLDKRFDECTNYSIDMLLFLKKQYPKKWDADWKLSTYLYDSCQLVHRYKEGYLAVKHAYEIHTEPPPMLALFYAYSYENEPGLPTIPWEEAEKLAKFAAEKENSCEPAGFLANLYRSVQNEQLADYWHQKAVEAREEGRYSTPITPDLLA